MSRISFPPTVSAHSAPVSAFAVMGFSQTMNAEPTWLTPAAGGYAVCAVWTQIYRLAYQQAQAALQPSRFQKTLEPCWN